MPRVTVTRQLLWDVRGRVTAKTRDLLWNVRGRVTKTRTLLWDVRKRVTKTRSLAWTVEANKGQGSSTIQTCKPYPAFSNAFSRVFVDHLVKGNSKVYWELDRRFKDAGPYTFQLQVSEEDIDDPTAWTNVGSPVVNSFYASDTTQRLFGKQLQTHYRIKLVSAVGTYYSLPSPVWGKLGKREWLLAREITRKELLRARRYTAIDGYLLIAKRSGTICSCVDVVTGEVKNSRCTSCYGTRYTGGYYAPISCVFFDMSPEKRKEYRDLQARGMTDDVVKVTRFIGFPMIQTRDVFVDKDSDERYYLDEINEAAEMRGVPIVVQPTIRRAPFTDIIYSFPIESYT